MMRWINLIVFLFCVSCLFSSRVSGQQSNPFDIIITKNAIDQDTSQISVRPITESQDSASIVTDTSQTLIDQIAPRSINLNSNSSSGTVTADSQILSTERVVNENNPFNIKETSGRIVDSANNSAQTIGQSSAIEMDDDKPNKSKSNWFAKLKPKKEDISGRDYSLNFIFWILMASLLILAAVINLKRKSFLNLYRAITNDNYLKLLQREENNGSSFFFLLLYFLFFLNAALFIYQVLINKFEIKGYKVFLFLFVALLVIYMIRLVSTFILQVTFPLEKEAKQYNFTIIMFNIIVGLLLIPVNILTAYAPFGPKMIYVGLGIIVLFYVLRQIRGLFIAARIKGMSYFHFFIYLCTFEVTPILWVISFVKNWYSVS